MIADFRRQFAKQCPALKRCAFTAALVVFFCGFAPASGSEASYTIFVPDGAVLVEGGLDSVAKVKAAGDAGELAGRNLDELARYLEDRFKDLGLDIQTYAPDVVTPKTPTAGFRKTTLLQAVDSGLVPDLTGLTLAGAVNLLDAMGIEAYLKSGAALESPVPADVELQSGTIIMPGSIALRVNGKDYSQPKPGYQTVVIDGKTGEVKAFGITCPHLPEFETARVGDLIRGAADGDVIAGAVLWTNFLTPDDIKALQSLGSRITMADQHEFLYRAHVFVAVKGKGMVTEAMDVDTPVRAAVFRSRRFAREAELESIAARWAGPVVMLSGVKPDDEVWIKPWIQP